MTVASSRLNKCDFRVACWEGIHTLNSPFHFFPHAVTENLLRYDQLQCTAPNILPPFSYRITSSWFHLYPDTFQTFLLDKNITNHIREPIRSSTLTVKRKINLPVILAKLVHKSWWTRHKMKHSLLFLLNEGSYPSLFVLWTEYLLYELPWCSTNLH